MTESAAPIPSAGSRARDAAATSAGDDAARRAPGVPRRSALVFVLPVLSILLSGLVWWRTDRELTIMRESQRAMASDLASLRKAPIVDVAGVPALGGDVVPTLVEFSDYECPFCIRHFQQTMPLIQEHYIRPGRIRYVFMDFPVDQLHPEAIRAHEAARCGGEQNKFWEMHTRLFSAPGTHTPEVLAQRAAEAGLDLEAYKSCVASGRTTERIRASADIALQFGASGTPAFFLGLRDRATEQVTIKQAITGAQPFEVFSRALDALLK